MIPAPLVLLWAAILRLHPGSASPRKTTCVVEQGRADCSHLKLKNVPPDLPWNISSLDMSHNRLTALDPVALGRYPGLEYLDASYNSLTVLGQGLCDSLPHLQRLSVQRNEVHQLSEGDLRNCSSLTHLDLSDNRLKFRGEPFSVLKDPHRTTMWVVDHSQHCCRTQCHR
ncbi:hypothetical protein NFI96_007975 [Prochilodus magdalenae]|nr:hypothetical protein NFI96_007975 [Prochilodus magdalenae]